MTNDPALARLQNLQTQILAMVLTGAVSATRVAYCTAGKFSDLEIDATLTMMRALGLVKES